MNTEHWTTLAATLADNLAEAGSLHEPAWRAAIENVPRHVFVPHFYTQQADGTWTTTTTGTPGGLRACYANEPLITALGELSDGQRVTMSSSSKPGLMVRMLEALDVHAGHRVLEIGVGTGYNAALLCHRLGDAQVASIDIGAELVERARERLASLDWAPMLVAGDGVAGMPGYGPWDRIIATCSVPAVPWAWAKQLCPDGLVLVDVKVAMHAGNLALLRHCGDRLEGRFLPQWAGFMAMRHADAAAVMDRGERSSDEGSGSRTMLDPQPWNQLVPWFLAHLTLPASVTFGYQGMSKDGPQNTICTLPDGSWCTVELDTDSDGRRTVVQAGPTRIWDTVEHWHAWWDNHGQPGWDRFGLTVTADGTHTVWLDKPGDTELGCLRPTQFA